jgi:DNA-binding response OmpR family regulator
LTADILLIDDDPMLRKLYYTALSAHQLSLETAANGFDGIEILRNGGAPKLVILDVMMPQMDGIETCRRIREMRRESFPILFLTATDSPKVIRGVIEAGGDDFVVKGSPLSEVLERIRFWLSTPLKGLPRSVRRAALENADASAADTGQEARIKPIKSSPEQFVADVLERSGVAKAGDRIHDRQVHAGILAYLMGVVGYLTDRGLRSALSFPDRYSAALVTLAPETRDAAPGILAEFEFLLETAKIAHAVQHGRDDAAARERDGPGFEPEGLNL